nr:hypothetical protein [Tanacetum cinerariifolium]
MIQPSPIVSTQGTYRTLSAPRSPKPKSILQKLKGKIVWELSELRKPLRIKVKHPQPAPIIFMVHVLTSAKIEYHQVSETQDLSLTEFVSTKEFEEKQVVTEVDDAIITEQVKEKYVEANTFVDTVMLSQPDPGT